MNHHKPFAKTNHGRDRRSIRRARIAEKELYLRASDDSVRDWFEAVYR